ncbi:TIGR04076 family protein [Candidatus Bipolaricaulota bacterium]|nr:TIGR04076 family protein [Candidatus Bipolaricaulota bacterium]
MKDVRISVIKKDFNQELIQTYMAPHRAASARPCAMDIGDSFLVSGTVMCPDGLCPWAWHDIESFVRIAAFEGKLPDQVPDNSWVRCCTDAFRPVTFLIEPIDDEVSTAE